MQQSSIVYPVLALFALTGLAWLWLYRQRIDAHGKGELSQSYMRTGEGPAPPERTIAAGRHFANLFEVPVMFYVTCILLLVTATVDRGQIVAAWLYVGLRAVHSLIHLSYNNPYHRFGAYIASCLILAVMVGRFALALP